LFERSCTSPKSIHYLSPARIDPAGGGAGNEIRRSMAVGLSPRQNIANVGLLFGVLIFTSSAATTSYAAVVGVDSAGSLGAKRSAARRLEGILRALPQRPLSNGSRELARSAIGKYRVYDETAKGVD
jgi:hypothetical protein